MTKTRFRLDRRQAGGGQWLPGNTFDTKAAAEQYAAQSNTHQRDGFRIIKVGQK